jgi:hypothetical protein
MHPTSIATGVVNLSINTINEKENSFDKKKVELRSDKND